MLKSSTFLLIFAIQVPQSADAQKDPAGPTRSSKAKTKIENVVERRDALNEHAKDNELEETIWEYKVIDSKSRTTLSQGKLRFKQDGIFAISMKKESVDDLKSNKNLNTINSETDSNDGSADERIGDILANRKRSKTRNKYTFRFDKDDEQELSGIATVTRGKKKNEGVWLGIYSEGKKKRWRFEMRSQQ